MMDYFSKLPIELQQRVLAYELVVPYRSIYVNPEEVLSQGICIIDGKTEFPYSAALFRVNRRISYLSRTISYSKNRFILGGDFQKSLTWLKSQPGEYLALITRFDLLILPEDLLNGGNLDGWGDLIEAIPDHLNLSNLCLSIDACRVYPGIDQYENDDTDYMLAHQWLKPQYTKVMQPWQATTKYNDLKDFFVFYPKYRSEEAKLEKVVKGSQYDSIERGKRCYLGRDWRLIHGWEWSEFDDTGDINWDWLDFEPDNMFDVEKPVAYHDSEAYFRYTGDKTVVAEIRREREKMKHDSNDKALP